MSKSVFSAACFAASLLTVISTGSVQAQETGVASIHEWVKVGRRTCMVDHFHDGSGNGATRRQAEAAAIRSWADFTAWEYGSPWARYSLALSKSVSCSRGGGDITCNVSARPCRPY